MNMATIAPEELDRLRRRGEAVELIDVRTPFEFRQVHAESARLVPLDRLDPRAVVESRDGMGAHPLYLICRSGSRSRQAAERFHRAGYPNVVNVKGGTLAWERAGLPVVRGERAMSLERQVRIAAGSLVVLGCSLGSRTPAGWEWSSPGCPGTARRRPSTGFPPREKSDQLLDARATQPVDRWTIIFEERACWRSASGRVQSGLHEPWFGSGDRSGSG